MKYYEVFLEQDYSHRTREKRVVYVGATNKEHAIHRARIRFNCRFEYVTAYEISESDYIEHTRTEYGLRKLLKALVGQVR